MKKFVKLLFFIAIAFVLYCIWSQLPFGSFFWLLAMNGVLIGVLFLFFVGTKNVRLSMLVRVFAVFLCGLMCIYSFNKYINPDSIKIYSNSDHHALAIEGVRLSSPHNFEIVGSSNRALFDNKNTKGSVTLSALSRDSLVIASVTTDFSNPIYECNSQGVFSTIVPSNYEFNAGQANGGTVADKVTLVDVNGNKATFSIVESYREPNGFRQKIKCLLFGNKAKCARYTLEYAAVDTSYDIGLDGCYSTTQTINKRLKEGDTFNFINQQDKKAKLTVIHTADLDQSNEPGLAFELYVENNSSTDVYRSKKLCTKKVAIGDTFELLDSTGNIAQLSIVEKKGGNTGSFFSKKHFGLEIVVDVEKQSTVSSFDTFLKQGYPLASIFPANKSMIDLNGVYLVRPQWKRVVKDKNIESVYSEPKYRLVFNKHSTIKEVYINGERRWNALNAEHSRITFKTNTLYAIGNGTKIFEPFKFKIEENGALSLRFQMPKYRVLNAEYMGEQGMDDERSFMIVSTLLDPEGQTLKMVPRNILLYDFFSHRDNKNHISPSYISFRRDKSKEPLRFSIFTPSTNTNKSYASADETVEDIATVDNPNVSWMIDVDNFKDYSAKRADGINAPYNYKHLVVILLCCIVASLVLVAIRSSAMEGIAHIVLLSFLTIRVFLLWRISVFPPVEAITINEFNDIFRKTQFLQEITPLSWIIVSLLSFYVILLVVKIVGVVLGGESIVDAIVVRIKESAKRLSVKPEVKKSKESVKPEVKKSKEYIYNLTVVKKIIDVANKIVNLLRNTSFRLSIAMGVSMLFCIGLHIASNNRIVNILLPVSLYFFWDFVINKLLGKEDGCRSGENEWSRTLLIFINLGTTFFMLFMSDGGYGIMFLAYAVISFILHLSMSQRLDGKIVDSSTRKKGVAITLLTLIGAPLFIATYKRILVGLFNSDNVWWIVGIVVLIILCFLLYVIDERFDIRSRRTRRFLVGIVTLSFMAGGAISCEFKDMKGSHTEHRVRVLTEMPNESLGKMASLQQERKFLQASLNDWIMSVYVDKGRDVSDVFGENSRGYFKIHPHSKHGALWGAQCTDISVVRFLVAEHGSGVVWLLITLLVLMLISGFVAISNRLAHWKRSLAYQLPLLLLVQALIVYFALTRHFIFIGQDFPMISITSNVTSVMFILIIGVWIYVCNASCSDEQKDRSRERNSANNGNSLSDRFKYYVQLCAIFLIIILCFIGKQNNKPEEVYNVRDCVKALCSTLGTYEGRTGVIADAFERFQDEQLKRRNEGRRAADKVYDIRNLYDGQECLRKFCRYVGYDYENPNIIESDTSIINRTWLADTSYGLFCRSVFNRFVKKGENDTDALVFLVPKKQTDDVGRVHTRFCFSFNPHYYTLQMPNKINDSWRGSIVEQPDSVVNTDIVSYNSFDVHIIPKEWGDEVNDIKIVEAKASGVSIVGDNKPTTLNRGDVCVLKPTESVINNRGVVEDMRRCGNATYWAKNVLINGVTSFVYPMGDKMFWMHHYAEQIKSNTKLKKTNANVEITLSRSLTDRIVQKIRSKEITHKLSSISAVVANGNGEIWAMVGCHAPKYRVNPNDKQQIDAIEDSLKLIGEYNWGVEAERFFANPAIIALAHGPGSSQKPLVWTAVASAYNDDMWKNLTIKNNDRLSLVAGKTVSPFWGGVSLGEKDIDRRAWNQYNNNSNKKGVVLFRSISSDEVFRDRNGRSKPITLERYITKSSNYYNAALVHLGSLPYDRLKEAFDNKAKDSVVRRVPNNLYGFDFAKKAFPTLSLGGRKDWAFCYQLQKSDILDRSSALLTGFANMGLHISDNAGYYRDTTARINYSHYLSNDKFGFAYPSASTFLNYRRVGNRAEAHEIVNYGVRQTAIGARSVWEVSPLKMAEMYGRMISLNKGYTLTIHKREPNEVGRHEFDLDQKRIKSFIANRKDFIKGLSNVFNTDAGTANVVKAGIKRIDRSLLDGLYFYAKTGTIDNGKDIGKGHVEDHLLAVVITNQDLAEVNDWDALQKVRFVVIYLADLGYRKDTSRYWSWSQVDASIIAEVIRSEEFKKYMFNN